MTRRFARPGGPNATSGHFTPGAVTASATPHTFGVWSDLVDGASVLRDVVGIWTVVTANIGQSGVNTQILMEVGLGNTGDAVDKTILTGYPFGGLSADVVRYFPLHVPAGVRIAARIQGTQVSETVPLMVMLDYGTAPPGFGGFSRGEGLNVDSSTSGFTHGDLTDNAWEEVVASTSVAYRAVSYVAMVNATTAGTVVFTVDVGQGAGGSEQVVGSYTVSSTTSDIILWQFGPWYIARPVAEGSRLALRKNTTLDMTGTIIGWR
jgi:hypothetical protein